MFKEQFEKDKRFKMNHDLLYDVVVESRLLKSRHELELMRFVRRLKMPHGVMKSRLVCANFNSNHFSSITATTLRDVVMLPILVSVRPV